MPEQVISCASACTVTVVHEFALPVLNMSIADASALMGPITLVFCVAWGIRALLRVVNSPEVSSIERSQDD